MRNSRIIALTTIALILVAGLILWLSGGLEALALRLFGPPEVKMVETHDATEGVQIFDHSTYDELV